MWLTIPILLGLIPATIARGKGRSFFLWWAYGSSLLIFALPHAILLQADVAAAEARAMADEGRRKCHRCAELVKRDAVVCRFCGAELASLPQAIAEQPATNREMWLGAAVVATVIILLVQLISWASSH